MLKHPYSTRANEANVQENNDTHDPDQINNDKYVVPIAIFKSDWLTINLLFATLKFVWPRPCYFILNFMFI